MKIDNKLFFPTMEKNRKDRIKEKIFEIIFEADIFYGRHIHASGYLLHSDI